jgi:hypothetical protein
LGRERGPDAARAVLPANGVATAAAAATVAPVFRKSRRLQHVSRFDAL